ncbi:MAG: transcriptional regulator, family [Nitrosospira multiformis]|nr:transcriptional regulator, family [Nitrosospira multiformis]
MCVLCGRGELVRDTRDVPFTYKGQKTFIENIQGQYCSNCGRGFFGPNDDPDDKLMSGMDAFKELVDAMVQEQAVFVAKTRQKLSLDQRQAGEIFGGGVNAFSRYESGKVRTPMSVMQLLTLLDRHPELLEEIRQRRYRIGGAHEFREEASEKPDMATS